jgi:type II secretory pathway component GspD/PulD (secretin)
MIEPASNRRTRPRARRGPGAGATAVIAALLWTSLATGQQLQIIELRYRLAEQILPALQPLVGPGGVLTGTESTLFVRTSHENFEQIRQAVALLDRAPRQLLISVGQGTVETLEDATVQGSATFGDGDVQVGVNRPPAGETGVAVQARGIAQRASLHNVSSIRTIEGNEAYVAIGQLVPITNTEVVYDRYGQVLRQTTDYHDVSTGFYATVRVSDDRVTLDISPRQQRVRGTGYGTVVDTAGSVSTLSGRLGEWLPLGAVQESAGQNDRGLLVWGRRSSESRYNAWVKVDELTD